ncbi:MAG: IS1 family transposase [Flavisolibacter sp.]|nr:IS1 family transposase [Flavisolibacter sp.]
MINCKFCKGRCIQYGRQGHQQRFKCKVCGKTQQAQYKKHAYGNRDLNSWIIRLIKESCSTRGIARLLKISIITVVRRIRQIAASIVKPAIRMNLNKIEVDELKTYIKRKSNEYWIAYALYPATGEVIDFAVGKRTKSTLKGLIETLLLARVRKIHTDHLPVYRSLIPRAQHRRGAYTINHIERHNLTLRTHLKRLARKTICYSKSPRMLEACFKIYVWG